jgi:hypothetical protein
VVAVSEKQQKVERGTCIWTSTVGWRTLQRYSMGPLPWLDDVDDDGRSEFILWDSFPLRDGASMAEYALIAWVYRLAPPDELVMDWELTRTFARSLAKEYRSPSEPPSGSPDGSRAKAAEALEEFAEERCRVEHITGLFIKWIQRMVRSAIRR